MDRIDSLISRYLSDNINPLELEELLEWVDLSAENKSFFSESNCIWNIMNKQASTIDINEEFDFLLDKINEDKKKIVKFNIFLAWQKFAAVLFLPLLFASAYFFINRDSHVHIVEVRKPIAEVLKEVYTTKGVRANVVLPDGTLVILNSDSKIIFPSEFLSNERRVKLIGEAFFKVSHNVDKPFILSSQGLEIKVLGTSFNVNSYDNNIVETTLFEGSVELSTIKHEKLLLKPGYTAKYNSKTNIIPIVKSNLKQVSAWKTGGIIFSNTPMSEVKVALERWFGVEIEIQDKRVNEYSFTANLRNKNLAEVLSLLKKSSPIEYKIDKEKVRIFYKIK